MRPASCRKSSHPIAALKTARTTANALEVAPAFVLTFLIVSISYEYQKARKLPPSRFIKALVPDLPRLNRLDRKHLIRLHLLHPLGELHCFFLGIEHHPVVQPACSNLVALPHRLGHGLPSKQSIQFQVLHPKRLCVLIFPVSSAHRYTPFW